MSILSIDGQPAFGSSRPLTSQGHLHVFHNQGKTTSALPKFDNLTSGFVGISVNEARLQLGLLEDAKALARSVLASNTNDIRAKPGAASNLVVAAVFEGKMDEARAAAQRLLLINPTASISSDRRLRARYKDQEFVERILDALAKAGVPKE